MIILFAPSEGKRMGGENPPGNLHELLFPELSAKRQQLLEYYERNVREGSYEELSELFGIKNEQEFERFKSPLASSGVMKAVERYDGVAYDYLHYSGLDKKAQAYIDDRVIIFSNLFGPIRARDRIPDYKLKQGSSIGTMAPEKFYKEHFSAAMDALVGEEEVLDLRAGFYDKFYVPARVPLTLKFLKDGKVVSHWAKAYRGIVLRTAAQEQVGSFAQFLKLNIDGLHLEDISETKKKYEVIYRIL